MQSNVWMKGYRGKKLQKYWYLIQTLQSEAIVSTNEVATLL